MSTPKNPLKLPGGPIDWKAWEAEASQPRGLKGRKYGPEVRKRMSDAQRARFAAKRATLAEALAAARAAEPVAPPDYSERGGLNVTDALLGAMQPGAWYSPRDMHAVSGAKYHSCKAWAPLWHRKGILDRAQNPVWKPPERTGAPQEPKWLYRLSGEGEQRHRLCAALL